VAAEIPGNHAVSACAPLSANSSQFADIRRCLWAWPAPQAQGFLDPGWLVEIEADAIVDR
jgi:hypothetical protein